MERREVLKRMASRTIFFSKHEGIRPLEVFSWVDRVDTLQASEVCSDLLSIEEGPIVDTLSLFVGARVAVVGVGV